MNEELEKFWMIYGHGQGRPTYQHPTRASAEQEARRLAEASPGVTFYVLEATKGFVAQRPVMEFALVEPRPF